MTISKIQLAPDTSIVRVYLQRPGKQVVSLYPFLFRDAGASDLPYSLMIESAAAIRRPSMALRGLERPRHKAGFLQGIVTPPGRIHVSETFGFYLTRKLRSSSPRTVFVEQKQQ